MHSRSGISSFPEAAHVSITSHGSLIAIATRSKVHFINIYENNIDLNYSFDFSEFIEDDARIEHLALLDESGSIALVMGKGQVLCVWNSLLLQGEESPTGHNFTE